MFGKGKGAHVQYRALTNRRALDVCTKMWLQLSLTFAGWDRSPTLFLSLALVGLPM